VVIHGLSDTKRRFTLLNNGVRNTHHFAAGALFFAGAEVFFSAAARFFAKAHRLFTPARIRSMVSGLNLRFFGLSSLGVALVVSDVSTTFSPRNAAYRLC